jgi:hypothetical protein
MMLDKLWDFAYMEDARINLWEGQIPRRYDNKIPAHAQYKPEATSWLAKQDISSGFPVITMSYASGAS